MIFVHIEISMGTTRRRGGLALFQLFFFLGATLPADAGRQFHLFS